MFSEKIISTLHSVLRMFFSLAYLIKFKFYVYENIGIIKFPSLKKKNKTIYLKIFVECVYNIFKSYNIGMLIMLYTMNVLSIKLCDNFVIRGTYMLRHLSFFFFNLSV